MAKPAIFVSSTFIDLRYVRETIATFIESMGYEHRLFEKGGVGFDFQQPIDESCYESVDICDMFILVVGGRYGAPASEKDIKNRLQKYNSITKKEYLRARAKGMPIHIFVDKDVLAEYKTYNKNSRNKSINYAFVDNKLIFELIRDIYSQDFNNFVQPFSSADDIVKFLKEQWASQFQTMIRRRSAKGKAEAVPINSFKLFYYRKLSGKSPLRLATEVGCDREVISRLEKLKSPTEKFTGYHVRYFPECDFQLFSKIEQKLNCVGKLRAGQDDDFVALFLEFYLENRGKYSATTKPRHPMLNFETKIVVFDFDGTIAVENKGLTTWERLWIEAGYSANECAKFHAQFRKGVITHDEWCEITLEKFRLGNLTQNSIRNLAKTIDIMPGFGDVVQQLQKRNIKMYIVSGSIKEIIDVSLAKHVSSFREISANEIEYDASGVISRIVGTKYDFAGKAEFIKRIINERSCSPMDVLFVGNAGNDAWASRSGARTLCVNPTTTDHDNPKVWTNSIRMMKDMREILPFIK